MDTLRTDDLRQAVAAGDWPAAMRLWEVYAAGIRADIDRGACTQVRLEEAREFLDWARRKVSCARAQLQSRLNAIHAASLYASPPSQPPASLRKTL